MVRYRHKYVLTWFTLNIQNWLSFRKINCLTIQGSRHELTMSQAWEKSTHSICSLEGMRGASASFMDHRSKDPWLWLIGLSKVLSHHCSHCVLLSHAPTTPRGVEYPSDECHLTNHCGVSHVCVCVWGVLPSGGGGGDEQQQGWFCTFPPSSHINLPLLACMCSTHWENSSLQQLNLLAHLAILPLMHGLHI